MTSFRLLLCTKIDILHVRIFLLWQFKVQKNNLICCRTKVGIRSGLQPLQPSKNFYTLWANCFIQPLQLDHVIIDIILQTKSPYNRPEKITKHDAVHRLTFPAIFLRSPSYFKRVERVHLGVT
jgi:hypothetical protein